MKNLKFILNHIYSHQPKLINYKLAAPVTFQSPLTLNLSKHLKDATFVINLLKLLNYDE